MHYSDTCNRNLTSSSSTKHASTPLRPLDRFPGWGRTAAPENKFNLIEWFEYDSGNSGDEAPAGSRKPLTGGLSELHRGKQTTNCG